MHSLLSQVDQNTGFFTWRHKVVSQVDQAQVKFNTVKNCKKAACDKRHVSPSNFDSYCNENKLPMCAMWILSWTPKKFSIAARKGIETDKILRS